jgi:hypothetical protein
MLGATMKTRLCHFLSVLLFFAAWLPAQEPAPSPTPLRTPGQIDQLLGPIALYPDALIALILPASTASADIVLASRFLQAGNDPAGVDGQPWDDSVRSLSHYPEIVKWMDQNLAWTKQVGDVFVAQPVDVMQSVQRLRTAARAAGTLNDTPQQQVVLDGDVISIVPAQPDVIYVPYYDPDVVYVARSGFYNDPYLTFGVGFPVGAWLSFNLDWGNRRIWFVSHDESARYWRDHRDWRHPVFPGRPSYVRDPDRHPWRPVPDYTRVMPTDVRRVRAEVVRPTPLPSAPPRPPIRRQDLPQTSPDNRDRASQADERGRDRNPSPARQVIAPAPVAPAPVLPPNPAAVRPQTPPPDRRAEDQRGRNDTRQPDQRGRESQGNPANRPPTSAPPQAERTPPAQRQGPAGPPAAERARPAPPAPTPPAGQNQPPSIPDEKKKSDRD